MEEMSAIFGALSNPNRLQIFLRLIACCSEGDSWLTEPEPCPCVSELGEDTGLAMSTISHHMKELSRAGLIRMDRNGQKVECRIDPSTLEKINVFFGGCCKPWKK